jgi:hypothetical protein
MEEVANASIGVNNKKNYDFVKRYHDSLWKKLQKTEWLKTDSWSTWTKEFITGTKRKTEYLNKIMYHEFNHVCLTFVVQQISWKQTKYIVYSYNTASSDENKCRVDPNKIINAMFVEIGSQVGY